MFLYDGFLNRFDYARTVFIAAKATCISLR